MARADHIFADRFGTAAPPVAPVTTWLMVAHCFNMDGRAASQTLTDRLDALQARGVRPVVISAPTGTRDRHIAHHRILSPAPSGLLFEGRQWIEGHVPAAGRRAAKAILTAALLPAYLLEKITLDLDSQWSWFLTAVPLGWMVLRRRRPALVYSSAGPPSSHLAGWLLGRLGRLPWMAEIHDPLVYDADLRPPLRRFYQQLIETIVWRHAGAVIYFTRTALEDARRRQGPRANLFVLRPGARPPVTAGIVYRRRDRIHFGHFGSLDRERNLSVVVRGIHELVRRRPQLRRWLCLDVYGTDIDPTTRAAAARCGLDDILWNHGRLECDPSSGKSGRQRVIEAMRRTDVLILLHGNGDHSRSYIPSKLYEYLLMRRPILCLADPTSELAELLRPLGHDVVDGRQPAAVAAAFAGLVDGWLEGGLPDRPVEAAYPIEDTVARLVAIAAGILARAKNAHREEWVR